jgi:hypothetical protein
MKSYNYKVIAELRHDLSNEERETALKIIKDLQNRLKIVNIDSITYCKKQPIKGYDDFGAVAFFFAALKDINFYFSRLEHYDLTEEKKRIAV